MPQVGVRTRGTSLTAAASSVETVGGLGGHCALIPPRKDCMGPAEATQNKPPRKQA